MSALATVCGCASSGAGGTTEVEERVALHFASAVTAPQAAGLALLDDPPAGSPVSALGLRDLLEFGAQLLDLFASARPADGRAMAPDAAPTADAARPVAGLAPAELKTRADSAVGALRHAVSSLDAASPANRPARLLALADAGVRVALPLSPDEGALAAQATTVLAAAHRLLDSLDAAEAAFDRSTADVAAVVAHDLARIRQLFGPGFPAVPTFATAYAGELKQSTADPALLGTDPLAPATWLAQHAHVRASARRLADALIAAEMFGGSGMDAVWAAQLPHTPGSRWIGLPRESTAPPTATASLVAHSAAAIDFTKPLAGLLIDQWSDIVPADHETTGMSFHYDAPGARAPQTIVVAVPGDPRAASWTVEALAGTVRETVALARIRALDGDDLDAVGRFLPAIYLPFNLDAKTPSVNLAEIISRAVTTANAVFMEQG
jgi:hypothetical protein